MYGVAAGAEHMAALRDITPVAGVIDIGANRGQFALVARGCFPDAEIVSFEPLAGPAQRYREIFRKDNRTSLYQCAIGPNPGRQVIHVSRRDDSSSMLSIGARQRIIFPGTEEVRTEEVEVRRLEEVVSAENVRQPTLLKIDVQGYELAVLEGCSALIEYFSWVYVECSFIELYMGQSLVADVIRWLDRRRFELRGVYNLVYDQQGKSVQGDFLFGKR